MSSSQICDGQQGRLAVGRERTGEVHAEADGERLVLCDRRRGDARCGARRQLAECTTLDAHGSILPIYIVGSILARLAEPRQGLMIGEPRPFVVAPRRFQAVHEFDRAERPAEDVGVHGDVEAAAGRPSRGQLPTMRSRVRVNASGSAP